MDYPKYPRKISVAGFEASVEIERDNSGQDDIYVKTMRVYEEFKRQDLLKPLIGTKVETEFFFIEDTGKWHSGIWTDEQSYSKIIEGKQSLRLC
ncbi:MAG: hypothetical protein Fur0022_37730 [Anaerolineales bacterium]